MSDAIAAGNHFSVLLKDGVLLSSGENTRGQLGRGAGNEASLIGFAEVTMPADLEEEIVAIASGQNHSAFITESGALYLWGFNNLGALGQGTTSGTVVTTPREIVIVEDGIQVAFASVTLATQSSFAISTAGDLYVFGNNQNGQLGIGSQTNQGSPVKVPASAFGGEAVAAVSSGTSFTLVLTESGDVYAMGRNADRQLGPNGFTDPAVSTTQWRSTTPVSVPIPLEAGDSVVAVEAGGNTSIAVTASGKVYGWGQTDFGQLLQGSVDSAGILTPATADVATPTLLEGLPADIAEVQVGSRWVVARTTSGEVWVWGNATGDEGEAPLGLQRDLGAGVAVAPMRVPGLEGVEIVDIVIGPNHTLAISEDGTVYGWGSYAQGRMGFAPNGAPAFLSGAVNLDLVTEGYTMVVGTAAAQNSGEILKAGALLSADVGAAIYGFGGNDTIVGSVLGDHLEGGLGDDYVFGGQGDDTIRGGEGDDTLDGAEGADDIAGGSGRDVITGKAGDDLLGGGEGDDTLLGGAGDDDLAGGAGKDILWGDAGNDVLSGGDGNDGLRGGAGDDVLVGGAGFDLLYGGEGADVFRFLSEADSGLGARVRDRIFDWNDGDAIDLSAIDANGAAAGEAAFAFVGGNAFTEAGQIRVVTVDGRHTVVQGNTDGNLATVEFEIELNETLVVLAADDFLL